MKTRIPASPAAGIRPGLALFALLLLAAPPARPAPIERDMGLGLAYFRVHELPADLPTDESVRHRPCILDIRYVKGGHTAAAALFAWLKFHSSPRAPVFLLANPETGRALLAPINWANSVAGLVILGPAARNFQPDLALPVRPEDERRAYDALDKGAPIGSLVTVTVDKVRDDEERLDRERQPDGGQGDQAPEPERQAAAPAPQPLDPVLQRAVQLHRALLALKRL